MEDTRICGETAGWLSLPRTLSKINDPRNCGVRCTGVSITPRLYLDIAYNVAIGFFGRAPTMVPTPSMATFILCRSTSCEPNGRFTDESNGLGKRDVVPFILFTLLFSQKLARIGNEVVSRTVLCSRFTMTLAIKGFL